MKLKKMLISLLAVGTLSCSVLGMTSCAQVQNFFSGVTLEYELSDDGTYYILTDVNCILPQATVVIPEKYKGLPVQEIGHSAFQDCDSLTSVTIPDSVTSIGWAAFDDCDSLTSVTIPDSVTSISLYAFYNCTSLASVTIPDGVTFIGERAFYGCGNLTSIEVDKNNANYSSLDGNLYNKDQTQLIQYALGKTATSFIIPDGVTSIGKYAFGSCSRLTSVTIPESVTSIGSCAFESCSKLTSVTIPNSVTSIGGGVFSLCDSLTSIEVDKNNANYSSLDGNLYNKGQTQLIQYALGKTATSFTIPDNVTSIVTSAFYGVTSLTSVTISNSVIFIGYCAFYNCTSLTSITYNGAVEEWKAISKVENWNYNIPAKEVVCIDGTVSLN